MLPSAALGAARRAAEKAALAKVKAGWTKAEAEAVVAACRAREKRQAAPDRPEDAAKLPVLAVKDVPVEKGFSFWCIHPVYLIFLLYFLSIFVKFCKANHFFTGIFLIGVPY